MVYSSQDSSRVGAIPFLSTLFSEISIRADILQEDYFHPLLVLFGRPWILLPAKLSLLPAKLSLLPAKLSDNTVSLSLLPAAAVWFILVKLGFAERLKRKNLNYIIKYSAL